MTTIEPSFDPIPASGEGAETFAMPDLFFLTHRKQIDEWAALRNSASSAYLTWMREFVHPAILELVPDGYEHLYVREGRYRSSLLVPPDTPIVGTTPAIGLGLSWSTSASEMARPFVAVEVASGTTGGDAAREAALVAGGRSLRSEHGFKSERRWPVWRYLKLSDAWWADLDATLELVTAEVSFVLTTFRSSVETGAAAAAAAAAAASAGGEHPDG